MLSLTKLLEKNIDNLEIHQVFNLKQNAFSEQAAQLSASYYDFVKAAWQEIEGTNPYVDGWHIQAICEHLEALKNGQIKNLLINIPPRMAKSLLTSVFLVPWWWTSEPEKKFLYASYASALAKDHSLKCRRLVESQWYKDHFGHLIQLRKDQNAKSHFENTLNGSRRAAGVGSMITGTGGDILACDDPNNARDTESNVKRESIISWWHSVWSTRLNDKKTGRRILIQQRLHMKDISGVIMSSENANEWEKLILPMEYTKKRHCTTKIADKIWQDPRKEDGELLWSEKFGEKEVQELKKELKTSYNIAGQLQQTPSPEGGGILKRAWFKLYKQHKPPQNGKIIQSWDTAFGDKEDNCYSACTTWTTFKDEQTSRHMVLLLSLWRGKLLYPELREMAKRLYWDFSDTGKASNPTKKRPVDLVLIEDKATGTPLVYDLHKANIPAIAFNPSPYGGKIERVHYVSQYVEGGLVWVPAKPPNFDEPREFAEEFLYECEVFPKGESRDMVDTLSQVLIHLKPWLTHPSD